MHLLQFFNFLMESLLHRVMTKRCAIHAQSNCYISCIVNRNLINICFILIQEKLVYFLKYFCPLAKMRLAHFSQFLKRFLKG